jgi:hypothetical protein
MNSMLDRRTLLELGAVGAAALAMPTAAASAQDKPRRGGTLTIGRNHDAFGSRPRAQGLKYHPIRCVYKLMDTWTT